MKAMQLTAFGADNLVIADVATPSLKANEVLVNIKAVSLNYLDLILLNGTFNGDLVFPYIPASDGAGVVTAVGADVSRWKPGDKVVIQYVQNWTHGSIDAAGNAVRVAWQTPGVLSEYTAVPEHGLVKMPANLSFEEAATLPIAALTAWYGLIEQAGLRPGQTVLTQGTGGVSLFALQIAKAAGAKVIATTSSEAKAAQLKALGADAVINYNQYPAWHEQVKALNGGEGVDITMDVVGSATIGESLLSVKENGFVGTAGFIAGPELPLDIHRHRINLNFIRIQGLAVGSVSAFAAMNRAIEVNDIHPVIDSVYPLEQTREAYLRLASGKHVGKIVITLS
ncbi:zinc-dependent alcohol dehydrogenase family protein [Chitinophaga qingshengii]|uniref:NAD(P)-dependent alcohol dehydrogenase n=1 Tax=Chitinophaga qingshengii TaxID=1569794 RepID=A0ABR7THV8_9BACT|nr:NAD(P)-dependent alcohol dehydrogenase [Chitinophaga qingshengii]MBC9929200.1 NAD(P)-dependent alcohol dehydrogenase [Chitinophaga qingshengii]